MKFNSWYLSSFLISFFVLIPIITVFTSFFESTSNYYEILKNTFLIEYILNSLVLLTSVLVLTFLLGTGTALTSGLSATSSVVTLAGPSITGVASFADGSASAPSITNTGDTNTGVFFSAADEVSINTGGTKKG